MSDDKGYDSIFFEVVERIARDVQKIEEVMDKIWKIFSEHDVGIEVGQEIALRMFLMITVESELTKEQILQLVDAGYKAYTVAFKGKLND